MRPGCQFNHIVDAITFHGRASPPKRTLADQLVSQQAVIELTASFDRYQLSAVVLDGDHKLVDLSYLPDERKWTGHCTCPTRWPCAHVFAVMVEFYRNPNLKMLETRMAPVKPSAVGSEGGSIEANTGGRGLRLDAVAKAHLGRALDSEERRFVQLVRKIHQRQQTGGKLTESDLWELGWPGHLPSFASVPMPVAESADEVEFWHVLAEVARQRRYPVPEFLVALQPSASLKARLAGARRQKEVETWMQTLQRVHLREASQANAGSRDLRFRLDGTDLVPETRLGDAEWCPVDPGRLTEFNVSKATELTPESVVLWTAFYSAAGGFGGYVSDKGASLRRWMRAMLLVPQTRARFVGSNGSPLALGDRPAQWHVEPPEQPDGDYALSLRDADGRPVGTLLMQLSGEPTLLITESGLYTGTEMPNLAEMAGGELRVPAPALETRAGLRLLDVIRAPIPETLAQRVRVVPLRPIIEAELSRRSSSTEYCILNVSAESPEGKYRHTLIGEGWREGSHKVDPTEGLVRLETRDLEEIRQLVRDAGFLRNPNLGWFEQRATRSFPATFHAFLERLPASADLRLKGDLATLKHGKVSGTVRLETLETEQDWFDLRVVVHVEDTTLTSEEIRLLMAARGQWVRLERAGWRRLEYTLTDLEESDLARLGLSARQLSDEPQRLHALQLADPAARRFLNNEATAAIERSASQLKARVAPPVPAAIRGELRPYQLEGFHFLAYLSANRFGGVLADDMGLGKTLQTLTWLAWLKSGGAASEVRGHPMLVVCPKSVQDNWRAEAERFYPELRVRVWTASDPVEAAGELEDAELHVVNYAQLRQAAERLREVRFLAVVLDEGQNIKNPSSQSAKVARELKADHRLVLTGTPIENRLMDLWSLMAFAMPGILGSRAGFNRLYDAKGDPLARTRLAARVRPFLLRRTKAQVAGDLPDRVEEDLYCELEGEQRSLYRAELKAAQQVLLRIQTQKALNKDRFHLLTSLLRLRQICCHPQLFKPDSRQAGAKMEALMETLEPLMEEGEKVLVFSQFVALLELLKPAFAERGWKHWYLSGETEDRGDLVREFQSHQGGGVFLISLKAGGAGLNLTAASYVVLFDPWWNPAVENQAIDRTHRIGQTRKIMAYRILIKDSIEEKIRKLQRSKAALADEVLGEERFSAALTLDDLRFLLAD